MSDRPFISIVIPTRDRPELLRYALWSVANQSDDDFEVILSDNPETNPAKTVFDEVFGGDSRAVYVRPDEPLDMVSNWNFGVEKARGKYVTILEDKFALHLDAIGLLKNVVQEFGEVEILNWNADVFRPGVKGGELEEGDYFRRSRKSTPPFFYDPKAVIKKRFSHDFQRGHEGGMYGIGKIVFGAFHRNLIDRIRKETGQLFHDFAPDYTSMTAGLMLAENGLDIGRSASVAVSSELSNGNLCQTFVKHAERFFSTFGDLDEVTSKLPIKQLPTPCHNIVGHAYLAIQDLVKGEEYRFNWAGIFLRCEKELELVEWASDEERAEHFLRLKKSRKWLPVKARFLLRLRDFLIRTGMAKIISRFEGWIFDSMGSDPVEKEHWELWTKDYNLVKSGPSNEGLIFNLKYDSLCRSFLDDPDSVSNSLDSSMIEKFYDKIERLDDDLKTFIERLIQDREESCRGYEAELSNLHSKVENFRGMIGRRDSRIEKLEAKLAGKK